jgi:toxin-antitoxin system PIN domain toxin
VTNPRIFPDPDSVADAFEFTAALRSEPNATIVAPGPRHWDIFTRLCLESGARGNLVTDAYLAALAIEWGCEWITTDRDFARFPGLRWRHPFRVS